MSRAWRLPAVLSAFVAVSASLTTNATADDEAVQAISELWARRSDDFLEKGLREKAIAAALKGIPASSDQQQNPNFKLAYSALFKAYFARRVQLPGLEGVNAGAVSVDRKLAVLRRSLPSGDRYAETIELWSVPDQKKIANLAEYVEKDGEAAEISISPDGAYAAAHLFDGNVKVWRTKDLKEVGNFNYKTEYIWDVYFSSAGNFLIVIPGNYDRPIIWSAKEEKVYFDAAKDLKRVGVNFWDKSYSILADADDDGNICLQAYKSTSVDDVYDIQIAFLSSSMSLNRNVIKYSGNNPYELICSTTNGLVATATMHPLESSYLINIFSSSTGAPFLKDYKSTDSDYSRIIFSDPHSQQMAVLTNREGVTYFDGVSGATSKPPASDFYSPVSPGIYSLDGEITVSFDRQVDDLWPNIPDGGLTYEKALAELSEADRSDVITTKDKSGLK